VVSLEKVIQFTSFSILIRAGKKITLCGLDHLDSCWVIDHSVWLPHKHFGSVWNQIDACAEA